MEVNRNLASYATVWVAAWCGAEADLVQDAADSRGADLVPEAAPHRRGVRPQRGFSLPRRRMMRSHSSSEMDGRPRRPRLRPLLSDQALVPGEQGARGDDAMAKQYPFFAAEGRHSEPATRGCEWQVGRSCV
jgi:hypothetical protein